ncbi:hypothetical protein BpHYR1_032920 [Brachionus plicatilis]|uniref:Gamma-glutamylcyclotransferase family protein n=1 Tax=Brachionus plicatilis TaxID=10195 RepID=A0A3M7SWA3_BRAPC|nr:hypothetical protein BpHYR1_032920 [Brachionus plicatilis]
MPSESNKKPLIKAFFYGTLKRNEPNHNQLKDLKVTFLSEAITVDKYPLIIASDYNIPFLLNKKGYGKHVHGELYLIDDEAKKFLDEFEGVHENLYSDMFIEVVDKKNNQVQRVCAYLLNNFKQDLLDENAVLFENYSSVNPFHKTYEKHKDTPENSACVYNAVKEI